MRIALAKNIAIHNIHLDGFIVWTVLNFRIIWEIAIDDLLSLQKYILFHFLILLRNVNFYRFIFPNKNNSNQLSKIYIKKINLMFLICNLLIFISK